MKAPYLLSAAALALAATPAAAQHSGHEGHSTPAPVPSPSPAPPPASQDHAAHGMVSPAEPASAVHRGHGGAGQGEDHAMTGAYGSYPMSREASGTAWQPDASIHGGIHGSAGEWMLMGHLMLNAVYDRQEGPRGGEKAFVSGMAMGLARRDFANGSTFPSAPPP